VIFFALVFQVFWRVWQGLFEVSGPAGQITTDFNSGYGFTAIIVAFLGRLNPWGILAAGLLMALTYIGGELGAIDAGGFQGPRSSCFKACCYSFCSRLICFINYRIRFGKGK
jgi:simple sugar transport system permease protein